MFGRSSWETSKNRYKKGKTLAIEAGVLANKLLDPEYDNDEALDEAYKEYENYKRLYEELKKEFNSFFFLRQGP